MWINRIVVCFLDGRYEYGMVRRDQQFKVGLILTQGRWESWAFQITESDILGEIDACYLGM